MGQHESLRLDRVFHDREGPSRVRPGYLEHHPIPPSQTERPSPGFTTTVSTTMFNPFRPLEDLVATLQVIVAGC
jgi:hypothetical protein